jgi:hypothetical protein
VAAERKIIAAHMPFAEPSLVAGIDESSLMPLCPDASNRNVAGEEAERKTMPDGAGEPVLPSVAAASVRRIIALWALSYEFLRDAGELDLKTAALWAGRAIFMSIAMAGSLRRIIAAWKDK